MNAKKLFLSFLILATTSFFSLFSYKLTGDEELAALESSIQLLDHLDSASAKLVYEALFSACVPLIKELRSECEKIETRVNDARNLIALIPGAFDKDEKAYFEVEHDWKEYHEEAIVIEGVLQLSRKHFVDLIEAIRRIKAFAPEFYRRQQAFTARVDSLGLFLQARRTYAQG